MVRGRHDNPTRRGKTSCIAASAPSRHRKATQQPLVGVSPPLCLAKTGGEVWIRISKRRITGNAQPTGEAMLPMKHVSRVPSSLPRRHSALRDPSPLPPLPRQESLFRVSTAAWWPSDVDSRSLSPPSPPCKGSCCPSGEGLGSGSALRERSIPARVSLPLSSHESSALPHSPRSVSSEPGATQARPVWRSLIPVVGEHAGAPVLCSARTRGRRAVRLALAGVATAPRGRLYLRRRCYPRTRTNVPCDGSMGGGDPLGRQRRGLWPPLEPRP